MYGAILRILDLRAQSEIWVGTEGSQRAAQRRPTQSATIGSKSLFVFTVFSIHDVHN